MKIDTNTLIRFLNRDLPIKQMDEIKMLIEKNSKIKLKFEEIKSFKDNFKNSIKNIENMKMPKNLEEKLSIKKKQFNKKNNLKKFTNFYKIAAGVLIIISFSVIFLLPNKTYLSENPITQIKKENNIQLFYQEEKLNSFLEENNNCSKPEEFIDENGRKIYAVSCQK